MQTLLLTRTETSEEGTFGTLTGKSTGTFICFTAELPKYAGNPDVLNERRTDCIPTGTYLCKIKTEWSKFGLVYRLENVPNRSEILIHKGNYAGDKTKGFKSDVEGCILLGTKLTTNLGQKVVSGSKVAFDYFMEIMKKEDFELEIIEAFK